MEVTISTLRPPYPIGKSSLHELAMRPDGLQAGEDADEKISFRDATDGISSGRQL
jgi:hypothetical protein